MLRHAAGQHEGFPVIGATKKQHTNVLGRIHGDGRRSAETAVNEDSDRARGVPQHHRIYMLESRMRSFHTPVVAVVLVVRKHNEVAAIRCSCGTNVFVHVLVATDGYGCLHFHSTWLPIRPERYLDSVQLRFPLHNLHTQSMVLNQLLSSKCTSQRDFNNLFCVLSLGMNYQPRYILQTVESPECIDILSYTFSHTTELESVDKFHKSYSYAYFRLFSQYLACKIFWAHATCSSLIKSIHITSLHCPPIIEREATLWTPSPPSRIKDQRALEGHLSLSIIFGQQRFGKRNGLCEWNELATLLPYDLKSRLLRESFPSDLFSISTGLSIRKLTDIILDSSCIPGPQELLQVQVKASKMK